MPKIKIHAKPQEHKTGFEAYNGATPDRPGAYRGVLKQLRWREYGPGSQGFNVLVELEADPKVHPDHVKYDGAPYWRNIVAVPAPGQEMKDGSIRSLETFLAAIGVNDSDPDIITDEGDSKSAVNITRLGKRAAAAILGSSVTVDLRIDARNSSEERTALEINNIRSSGEKPTKDDEGWAAVEPDPEEPVEADEEPEDAADEEADAEDEISAEERLSELKGLKVAELRQIATEDYDLDVKGLGKQELVEAIMGHEYETEDEPMATAPDESEDDEEDEIEVESEDDEEEEDDSDSRAAELAALDRTALKSILRRLNEERKVFKSTTDDQLREWILEEESTDAPF